MAQDMTRLKELLFDREARAITDLTARMDAVFERTGSQERFAASVASVLDEALARAEVEKHTQVAGAIAPLVVSTIRSEIRNSQDELAEALYPAMGRMVKDYVVSAFRDLADEINRRIEQNRFMLRARSLLTGRPVAELAMTYAPPPKVEEIYLVRRGSGELVGRWPVAGNPRDHTRSGVLAAINEVATDAFIAEEASLRRLDLGSSLVYMRASPAHLLFVRCSGCGPGARSSGRSTHTSSARSKSCVQSLRPDQPSDPEGSAAPVNALLAALAADLDAAFAAGRATKRRGGITGRAAVLGTSAVAARLGRLDGLFGLADRAHAQYRRARDRRGRRTARLSRACRHRRQRGPGDVARPRAEAGRCAAGNAPAARRAARFRRSPIRRPRFRAGSRKRARRSASYRLRSPG